jgi:membrane protein
MQLLRLAFREFVADRCGTAAAALAFYSAFSLPPILLIALTITSWIFGRNEAAREIERQLQTVFSPEVAGQIEKLLQSAWQVSGRGWVGMFAAATGILAGGTRAFAELQRVLNRAWEVEPVDRGIKGFALKRVTAFLMILAVTIVLLTSMAVSILVSVLGRSLHDSVVLLSLWQMLAPFVILTLLVGAIFKLLPDARVEWRDVWFGATVTGGLLAIAKYVFSIYFAHTTFVTVWGTMGTFALLLVWLYASAATLLFGAELTHARARHQGRQMQPGERAVRSHKPHDEAA